MECSDGGSGLSERRSIFFCKVIEVRPSVSLEGEGIGLNGPLGIQRGVGTRHRGKDIRRRKFRILIPPLEQMPCFGGGCRAAHACSMVSTKRGNAASSIRFKGNVIGHMVPFGIEGVARCWHTSVFK